MSPDHDPDSASLETQPDIEVVDGSAEDDRSVRASRIRERSEELVEALGADHPLVRAALEKADALDWEAEHPGEIRMR
jgi:hypothetical protein